MTDSAGETVIELIVNDHPGCMSHITGLFARRAYNLERIVCGPIEGSRSSRIILGVREHDRLEQVMNDLARLYDVERITRRDDLGREAFERIDRVVSGSAGSDPSG